MGTPPERPLKHPSRTSIPFSCPNACPGHLVTRPPAASSSTNRAVSGRPLQTTAQPALFLSETEGGGLVAMNVGDKDARLERFGKKYTLPAQSIVRMAGAE